MSGLRLPGASHRVAVIGRTGSGKTQGAVWQLSRRLGGHPWVIVNYKRDELIEALPFAEGIDAGPIKGKALPPLSVTRPHPGDDEGIEALMWSAWERGGVGMFFDEAYMVPTRSPAFQALLTQGRSKRIPAMILTQRPSWVSRFVFSEADFVQLYTLTDTRDIATVKQFMPLPLDKRLPGDFFSWWYDAGRHEGAILKPVPDAGQILDAVYERLRKRRKAL